MAVGLSIALLIGVMAAPAPAQSQYAAQTLIVPASAGQSDAVARMIGQIISFTQWPRPAAALTLCIAGPTRFSDRFAAIGSPAGTSVRARRMGANERIDGCDILYLGAIDFATRQRLIGAAHDRPILTIAEHDTTCRDGAMFCLDVGEDALSFVISLDAISRGRVRVDPRVLRLSDAHGDRP